MGATANGFPAFGNILAPPWMGFSAGLAGYNDQEFDVDLPPVTIAAGAVSSGNELAMDADTDFLAWQVQFVILPGSTAAASSIRVRIRDGAGRLITSEFCPVLDLNGPLVPLLPMRRGSKLRFDFQNTAGAGNATVWTIFKGWKRFICPGQAALDPPYTPMYRRLSYPLDKDLDDFEYPFTFTAAAAGDRLRVPLPTNNDADFLWRGVTGPWNTANNTVGATVGSVGVTFYDPIGVPLGLVGLKNPWASGQCGLFRELVLPSGGGRPSPWFPEVFVPRGGVPSVDLSFGGAATVSFSLRGLKLYGAKC